MPGTTVIIPYFQRQEGRLAAAIRSALAQKNVWPITVVVCDDESPVPAERDLAILTPDERDRVILVKQANAGPAPARNTALDAVPSGTDWIAFLDSDDEWEEWHLHRAQTALAQGYDFFFGDVVRTDAAETQFVQIGFNPANHRELPGSEGLYAFEGDFFTPNLTRSPVCTSTVVMRYAALGHLRFRTVPRYWEDLALWLEVACRTKGIVFDTWLQTRMSAGGVTIAGGHRSNEELQRLTYYMQHFMTVMAAYSVTPDQGDILRRLMDETRLRFAIALLALLRDGKRPNMSILCEFFRLSPTTPWTVVTVALGRMIGYRS